MTVHEQRMCELQADIFELSLKIFKCSSSYFIFRFMRSDVAKDIDVFDSQYNYYSPNNVMHMLKMSNLHLDDIEGKKYPLEVMRWIGYIYRAYQLITKKNSRDIYKILKAETLLSLYNSFHTYSVEVCVSKIKEMLSESRPIDSDYELFKKIALSF